MKLRIDVDSEIIFSSHELYKIVFYTRDAVDSFLKMYGASLGHTISHVKATDRDVLTVTVVPDELKLINRVNRRHKDGIKATIGRCFITETKLYNGTVYWTIDKKSIESIAERRYYNLYLKHHHHDGNGG